MLRQYLSGAVGDLILSTAATPLSTQHYTDSTLTQADDYYNHSHYRAYCYSGTAIGQERLVYDWVYANRNLLFTPVFSPTIAEDDSFELHHIFNEGEYRRAINLAIESLGDRYLVPLIDETTIKLTSTTDNLDKIVYTYEYDLPTTMTHLHRITVENGLQGVKLTGTVSGAFTVGETITGGTSEATGELSYGPDGGTYIRVRKVSGTFVVGETATGGTSEETCSTITAVESETAGQGVFYDEDVLDYRDWDIVKAYPSGTPKLRLNQTYLTTLDEDLYLRLEGQRRQPTLTADTGVCYLPPDFLVQKAITFLPQNKIQSNDLDATYRNSLILSAREPRSWANPRSKQVME